MPDAVFELASKNVLPFTLIYLKREDQVLLLKRGPEKQMQAGHWLGLGGKVEPGEDLTASAVREFKEESGLTLKDPMLRGTFSWIDDLKAGTLYLFAATAYEGELLNETEEGVLRWHNIGELHTLVDFAEHQKLFMSKILQDNGDFYCAMAVFRDGNMVQYADSDVYFLQRRGDETQLP